MDVMDLRRGLMMAMASGKKVICETGSYTPETDVAYPYANIPHGLGVKPDFIIAYADGIEVLASYSEIYIAYFCYSKINATTNPATKDHEAFYVLTRPGYSSFGPTYETIDEKFVGDTWFRIGGYNSTNKLKGGVTYHYVIGKYQE